MALEDYIRRAQQMSGQPINLGMPNQQFLDYWYQQGVRKRQEEEKKKEEERRRKELERMQEKLALAGEDQETIRKITEGILKGSDSPSEEQLKEMKKVVDYRTRMKAAGKDPNAVSDTRNAFEKWANLPVGQNWFLDVLDLLGRPGQAVMGALEAEHDRAMHLKKFDPEAYEIYKNKITRNTVDPEESEWIRKNPERWKRFLEETRKNKSDPLGAAWAGFSGEKKYSLSRMIAESQGRKDPNFSDKVFGISGEILLDPLNLIGTGLAKNTAKGAIDILGQTENVAKASNAARNALTALKEQALQSRPGQFLDDVFGKEGRQLDIHGKLTDDLIEAEREMKAFRSYYKNKALDDVSEAIKITGDIKAGKDVAKIMEQGNIKERIDLLDQQLKELEENLANIQVDKAMAQEIKDLQETVKMLKKSSKPLSKKAQAQQTVGNVAIRDAASKAIDQAQAKIDEFKSKYGNRIGTTINKLSTQEQKTLNEINKIKDSGRREALTKRFNQVEKLKRDPKLVQAAERLMNSDQEFRQIVEEAGIKIDDLAGYMAHVLSEEAEKILADESIRKIYPKVGGNKKILERTLPETVDEINAFMKYTKPELGGADFFEPNAFFATAKGRQRLVNFVALEVFKKKVLTNPKLAIKVEPGTAKPKNAVKINVSDFVVGDSKTKDITGRLGAEVTGGEFYVTRGVANSFKNFVRLANDQDTLVNFFKGYDQVLRGWKKLALLNPSYHINNVGGSLMSQHIRGMRMDEVVKYNTSSAKMILDAEKALAKGGLKSKNLTKAERNALSRYDEFLRQGLNQSGYYGEDFVRREEADLMKELIYRTKSRKEKALHYLNPINLPEGSRRLGDNADNLTRFATYLWARDKGKSVKEAADIVRETHFDYTELTKVEREVFRRMIPFYTFTRKTIPFLFKFAAQNPKALSHINTIVDESYSAEGQRPEVVPDYIRNALALPISPNKMFSINPPVNVLTQLQDPVEMVKSMLTPALRIPADIAYGQDYRGAPIENNLLYALGQAVPPIGRAQKAIESLQQGKGAGAAISDIIGFSNIKNYDEDKFISKKYRDLAEQYAKVISKSKKEGEPIPTISELRKAGIVSKNQASEQQIDEAKSFASLARKYGIEDTQSIQLLLKLKRDIESKDAENAMKWREYLIGRGVPEELVNFITGDYLDIDLPENLK